MLIMLKILQKESQELRKKALEVPVTEIIGKRVREVIKNMQEALESQDDGVAIAAPQIGESLRIFVMSGRVYEMVNRERKDEKMEEGKIKEEKKRENKVFINPKLVKVSREKEMMDEGCLSVRYLYGKVLRSKKATVEAYDEKGKKFTMGGSGVIAQIFQHETDHLDGVLFTDEAVDLEEIPPKTELRSMNHELRK